MPIRSLEEALREYTRIQYTVAGGNFCPTSLEQVYSALPFCAVETVDAIIRADSVTARTGYSSRGDFRHAPTQEVIDSLQSIASYFSQSEEYSRPVVESAQSFPEVIQKRAQLEAGAKRLEHTLSSSGEYYSRFLEANADLSAKQARQAALREADGVLQLMGALKGAPATVQTLLECGDVLAASSVLSAVDILLERSSLVQKLRLSVDLKDSRARVAKRIRKELASACYLLGVPEDERSDGAAPNSDSLGFLSSLKASRAFYDFLEEVLVVSQDLLEQRARERPLYAPQELSLDIPVGESGGAADGVVDGAANEAAGARELGAEGAADGEVKNPARSSAGLYAGAAHDNLLDEPTDSLGGPLDAPDERGPPQPPRLSPRVCADEAYALIVQVCELLVHSVCGTTDALREFSQCVSLFSLDGRLVRQMQEENRGEAGDVLCSKVSGNGRDVMQKLLAEAAERRGLEPSPSLQAILEARGISSVPPEVYALVLAAKTASLDGVAANRPALSSALSRLFKDDVRANVSALISRLERVRLQEWELQVQGEHAARSLGLRPPETFSQVELRDLKPVCACELSGPGECGEHLAYRPGHFIDQDLCSALAMLMRQPLLVFKRKAARTEVIPPAFDIHNAIEFGEFAARVTGMASWVMLSCFSFLAAHVVLSAIDRRQVQLSGAGGEASVQEVGRSVEDKAEVLRALLWFLTQEYSRRSPDKSPLPSDPRVPQMPRSSSAESSMELLAQARPGLSPCDLSGVMKAIDLCSPSIKPSAVVGSILDTVSSHFVSLAFGAAKAGTEGEKSLFSFSWLMADETKSALAGMSEMARMMVSEGDAADVQAATGDAGSGPAGPAGPAGRGHTLYGLLPVGTAVEPAYQRAPRDTVFRVSFHHLFLTFRPLASLLSYSAKLSLSLPDSRSTEAYVQACARLDAEYTRRLSLTTGEAAIQAGESVPPGLGAISFNEFYPVVHQLVTEIGFLARLFQGELNAELGAVLRKFLGRTMFSLTDALHKHFHGIYSYDILNSPEGGLLCKTVSAQEEQNWRASAGGAPGATDPMLLDASLLPAPVMSLQAAFALDETLRSSSLDEAARLHSFREQGEAGSFRGERYLLLPGPEPLGLALDLLLAVIKLNALVEEFDGDTAMAFSAFVAEDAVAESSSDDPESDQSNQDGEQEVKPKPVTLTRLGRGGHPREGQLGPHSQAEAGGDAFSDASLDPLTPAQFCARLKVLVTRISVFIVGEARIQTVARLNRAIAAGEFDGANAYGLASGLQVQALTSFYSGLRSYMNRAAVQRSRAGQAIWLLLKSTLPVLVVHTLGEAYAERPRLQGSRSALSDLAQLFASLCEPSEEVKRWLDVATAGGASPAPGGPSVCVS